MPHGGVYVNTGAWPSQLGIHDYYINPSKNCISPSKGIDLPPNYLLLFLVYRCHDLSRGEPPAKS